MIQKTIFLLFSVFIVFQGVFAQEKFDVAIIYDRAENESNSVQLSIKDEIESLLSPQYEVHFSEYYSGGDGGISHKYIEDIYNTRDADVLIAIGLISSEILSKRSRYPLPTIAAINIDNLFLQNDNSKKQSSSIHNFTFIQSPFDIQRDIETLLTFGQIKKVGVLVHPFFNEPRYNPEGYLKSIDNVEFELISIDNTPESTLESIDSDIDAVYVLSPLANYSPVQIASLFSGINEKQIPSISLMDYPMLSYGGYASFSSQENIQKIHRRIALNVSKIAEGKNPKNFPVKMNVSGSQLIINMESLAKTGVYPNWEVLDNAMLINVNKRSKGRKLTLKSAIAEGLQNNLAYQIAKKETEIADKDISLAKSNYLPQVEFSTKGVFLDKSSVNASLGTKGDFNWTADASFSQLILSEPAMANISIQKLLKESKEKAAKQSELDVVLDVAIAYSNYQQLRSLVAFQNENINVKNKNLSIAINKEKVGYSGKSEVYRWETELALAKAAFNSADSQLKAAQYQLNQILNRPVNEDFVVENSNDSLYLNGIVEPTILKLIDNPQNIQTLVEFLAQEATKNLPELDQIGLALQVQQRLLESNKRSRYTPTVALAGSLDYSIAVVNPGTPPKIPGVSFGGSTGIPRWNVAVVTSIPIFTGGSRKYKKQKLQLELDNLQSQKQDVSNKLEKQLRASLEKAVVSYRNLQLNKKAALLAQKNVDIVQNLYNEGQISITSLIDAQNASLGADIKASNSKHQFVVDLFVLQRFTGYYISLSTDEQRSDFIARFIQYNKNSN